MAGRDLGGVFKDVQTHHHNREDRSGVCPISLVPPTALASRTDAVSLDFRGGGVMIAVATAADSNTSSFRTRSVVRILP
jgi:hypothetical protein